MQSRLGGQSVIQAELETHEEALNPTAFVLPRPEQREVGYFGSDARKLFEVLHWPCESGRLWHFMLLGLVEELAWTYSFACKSWPSPLAELEACKSVRTCAWVPVRMHMQT